jgi:hypothetical protein
LPLDDCKLLELPVVADPQGNLTFIEQGRHVPFQITRVYHTYGIPGGAKRGGHAHRDCEELLVAMAGSFKVAIDDGAARGGFVLDRASVGLFLPRLIWRELVDFTPGAVCMVLASDYFDEEDYIRDYDAFRDRALASRSAAQPPVTSATSAATRAQVAGAS